jgi:hypothetical protein
MKIAATILLLSVLMFQRNGTMVQVPHPNKAEAISWDSTKHWKIYKLIDFNRVFRIPPDSLQYQESRPLNDDSMHDFLATAKKLADSINPMWMGCLLASYSTPNGKVHKAIISHYAGFFYCQPENAYFQLDQSQNQAWLSYFNNAYRPFITKEQ